MIDILTVQKRVGQHGNNFQLISDCIKSNPKYRIQTILDVPLLDGDKECIVIMVKKPVITILLDKFYSFLTQ